MTASIRLALLRCAKYNIGGSIYSLFDLEFSVLRASSEKPRQGAFASTFFASSMSFPQRDPRRQFVLDTPMPLLSFALTSVSATSPALTILREPFELVGIFLIRMYSVPSPSPRLFYFVLVSTSSSIIYIFTLYTHHSFQRYRVIRITNYVPARVLSSISLFITTKRLRGLNCQVRKSLCTALPCAFPYLCSFLETIIQKTHHACIMCCLRILCPLLVPPLSSYLTLILSFHSCLHQKYFVPIGVIFVQAKTNYPKLSSNWLLNQSRQT